MKRRHFILSGLPLALAGCGFHLRGLGDSQDIYVHNVYLAFAGNPDNTSIRALQNVLRQNHVTIASSESETPWKMVVSDFFQRRFRSAVGGENGSVREYEFNDGYTVTVFKSGENLGSVTVNNRSNISYNSSDYIGGSEEIARAHQELARENAFAAMRFLNSRAIGAQ